MKGSLHESGRRRPTACGRMRTSLRVASFRRAHPCNCKTLLKKGDRRAQVRDWFSIHRVQEANRVDEVFQGCTGLIELRSNFLSKPRQGNQRSGFWPTPASGGQRPNWKLL